MKRLHNRSTFSAGQGAKAAERIGKDPIAPSGPTTLPARKTPAERKAARARKNAQKRARKQQKGSRS